MMTRLQKAAMAWWNENDRPDKAHLHVVDVDDGFALCHLLYPC